MRMCNWIHLKLTQVMNQ